MTDEKSRDSSEQRRPDAQRVPEFVDAKRREASASERTHGQHPKVSPPVMPPVMHPSQSERQRGRLRLVCEADADGTDH